MHEQAAPRIVFIAEELQPVPAYEPPLAHLVAKPGREYVPSWRYDGAELQRTFAAARQNVGTQQRQFVGRYALGKMREDRTM